VTLPANARAAVSLKRGYDRIRDLVGHIGCQYQWTRQHRYGVEFPECGWITFDVILLAARGLPPRSRRARAAAPERSRTMARYSALCSRQCSLTPSHHLISSLDSAQPGAATTASRLSRRQLTLSSYLAALQPRSPPRAHETRLLSGQACVLEARLLFEYSLARAASPGRLLRV
jgi:hypothetical protein